MLLLRRRPPAAIILLALAALVLSGAPLAHGWWHAHEAGHHAGLAVNAQPSHGPRDVPSAEGRHGDADHPHLAVAGVKTNSRAELGAMVLALHPAVEPAAAWTLVRPRVELPHATLARVDPHQAPPPPTRAPPLR